MSNRKAVGIDLGTTFSAVAHIDAYGKPQIIPNAESERITPSVVLFDGSNAIVGTIAKNNTVAEPEKIVDFVKREIGKSKEQFHREFGGTNYSAEELSALILKKLKSDAEKYLKVPVTDAVITVPAYFNDSERTATITAGRLAGLNVLQIINEPTAAALAYGLDKLDEDQTVFVFDLGGGTFDVTLMRIASHRLEMVATNGDHRLGGKDWDDIIVNHVAEEFDRAHGENPLLDLQSYQDLQSRALAAKIQLSSRDRTTIVHSHNGKSIKIELTREEFEKMTRHLVEKCKAICEIVMREARMEWSEVNKILLVGGMTRMPMVREMIAQLTSVPLAEDVNPDEAVAVGAAIQAVLSLLGEEDVTGEKMLPSETRQQFSSREGGAHPGAQHHLAHPRGRALGRGAPRGIRLPHDQENDRDAGGREKFLRHRDGQHAARHRAHRRGREHAPGRVHAARNLRCRAAAVFAERFAGGVDLRIQRQPGAGSGGGSMRELRHGLDRAQDGTLGGGTRSRHGSVGAIERRLRCSTRLASRFRCRTIRASGMAGAAIIRPIPTSGSASIRRPIRATS